MRQHTPVPRPTSPLRRTAARVARVLLALSLPALLVACGGGDGDDADGDGVTAPPPGQPSGGQTASAVPADVLGAWITGSVSSVNFYNPNSGSWSAPSGNGLYYRFSADGTYEKGVLLQSSLYGCTMTVSFYETGTLRAVSGALRLTPSAAGRQKSVDNCVAKNNYEKTYAADAETLSAQRGRDEYGNDVLWIRKGTSAASAFRRAQ